MENNDEIVIEQPSGEPKLIIDTTIKNLLMEVAKWGKFISIVGFVFCGIIGLIALVIIFAGGAMFSKLSPIGARLGGGFTEIIGVIYLVFALIYYFPSKYLYDFSAYVKQAILIDDQESLNYAFSRMKSLFRFWGILLIVMLSIYALMIVFGIMTLILAATI